MAAKKSTKLQDGLREVEREIAEAIHGRCAAIEKTLRTWLNREKPIRTWQEFISLSEHQRKLVGLDVQKSRLDVSGDIKVEIVNYAKPRARAKTAKKKTATKARRGKATEKVDSRLCGNDGEGDGGRITRAECPPAEGIAP